MPIFKFLTGKYYCTRGDENHFHCSKAEVDRCNDDYRKELNLKYTRYQNQRRRQFEQAVRKINEQEDFAEKQRRQEIKSVKAQADRDIKKEQKHLAALKRANEEATNLRAIGYRFDEDEKKDEKTKRSRIYSSQNNRTYRRYGGQQTDETADTPQSYTGQSYRTPNRQRYSSEYSSGFGITRPQASPTKLSLDNMFTGSATRYTSNPNNYGNTSSIPPIRSYTTFGLNDDARLETSSYTSDEYNFSTSPNYRIPALPRSYTMYRLPGVTGVNRYDYPRFVYDIDEPFQNPFRYSEEFRRPGFSYFDGDYRF